MVSTLHLWHSFHKSSRGLLTRPCLPVQHHVCRLSSLRGWHARPVMPENLRGSALFSLQESRQEVVSGVRFRRQTYLQFSTRRIACAFVKVSQQTRGFRSRGFRRHSFASVVSPIRALVRSARLLTIFSKHWDPVRPLVRSYRA